MQHRFLRRASCSIITMGLLALAACGPQSNTPFDSAVDPALALQAEHAQNLQAIETALDHSNAAYGQMLAVWTARNSGNPPMMAASDDPFVACQPLPFDGVAQIVGPAGGSFTFGPHHLMVPPGAVAADKSIALIVNSDVRTRVTLLPHGTVFSSPVRLTLAYAHCQAASTHRVAFIDAQDQIIEWANSTDYPYLLKVEGWLNHFSDYAIAY